jgi:threonine/homoserine/homoserine lactone efflux protein
VWPPPPDSALSVQPLFEAVRWAGIAYLVFLDMEALRSAAAGRYLPFDREKTRRSVR